MDKSASASRASMDTVSIGLDDIERVVDWKVLYDKERVMIVSTVDGVDGIFNPYNGKVEDREGRRYLVSKPTASVMTAAEEIRKSIRPLVLIEVDGLKRVKSEKSVYVDPTDRKFRKSTGDLAPGYADLV